MLESLFNKFAVLKLSPHVFNMTFLASAESLEHIASYYSAPIFLEDFPVTEVLLKKRPWHRCFPVNFSKFL